MDKAKEKIEIIMKKLANLRQFKKMSLEELRESAKAIYNKQRLAKRKLRIKEGEIKCPVCRSIFKLEVSEKNPDIIYGEENDKR